MGSTSATGGWRSPLLDTWRAASTSSRRREGAIYDDAEGEGRAVSLHAVDLGARPEDDVARLKIGDQVESRCGVVALLSSIRAHPPRTA